MPYYKYRKGITHVMLKYFEVTAITNLKRVRSATIVTLDEVPPQDEIHSELLHRQLSIAKDGTTNVKVRRCD